MRSRKGLSEIVNVILLIVIIVALAGLFFSWSRNSATTKMDEISAELKQASALECYNAQFYVDSCTIYSTTKTTRLVLINNSNIRLFNLQLTINGEVSGSFNNIIEAGETAYLSTDTNFTVNRGNLESLADIDIGDIKNITLTNGACPKEILDISGCRIVNAFWPPEANVPSGNYYLEQSVTLSAGSGATIYYTLDGSTPTTDSNVYSGALTAPEDTITTLKAIAAKEGYVTSDINTWVYNITHTLEPPTADPPEGIYYGTIDVTLTAGEGADIYFVFEVGGVGYLEPYTGPITFSPSESTQYIENAVAMKSGYGTSSEFFGAYDIRDSNDNTIYYFNIAGDGYDVNGTIDNDANTISVVVPEGTDVTELAPIISIHRDASVEPPSEYVRDFTNPVLYGVVSGNKQLRIYTVTVTLEESGNSIVYDAPTKVLTITLSPDITLEGDVSFFVYDSKDDKFISTDKIKTTDEMGKVKPSPYDLSDDALTNIGFDTALFLFNYDNEQLSRFDIVDGSSNVLATISVKDITVISK